MGGKGAFDAVLLSFAAASVSFAITEASLFARLRQRLLEHSRVAGKLASCGYCLGHWAALILTVVYRPRLFNFFWPLDYALTAFVIAWFAAFQWALMVFLMEKGGK